MWCSVCQSDVATEVGADNRRVSCSNCGHLLGGAAGAVPQQNSTGVTSRPDTRAEEARQLLDRWARGHFFDPYGPPKRTETVPDAPVAASTVGDPKTVASASISEVAHGADASPQIAVSTDDARNVQTIDERDFVADSPKPDSKQVDAEQTAEQSNAEPDNASLTKEASTEKVAAVDNESEAVSAASGITESASSAELDRLTREIMARVSKITDARATTNDTGTDKQESDRHSETLQTSGENLTAASGIAASFPEPATSTDQSGTSNNDTRSTHAEPSAYDEPIASRSEVTHRMDATHQPARISEAASVATSAGQPITETTPSWYNSIGQMLAYLGIICLTAGTCGVIVSYFGGPASYAPYGWLGATIGQMFLFLGIVTLISAGMEQTSQELRQAVDHRMNEVNQRLDQIGTRIMRIEEASSEGPPRPHMLSQPEQNRSHTASEAISHDG